MQSAAFRLLTGFLRLAIPANHKPGVWSAKGFERALIGLKPLHPVQLMVNMFVATPGSTGKARFK